MSRPGESPVGRGEAHLPEDLEKYFWDSDFDALRWPEDAGFVLPRLLRSGGWDSVQWLRNRAGDHAIETWIRGHRGRGMSPERLRFWQLVLDLPGNEVDDWISSSASSPWRTRTA